MSDQNLIKYFIKRCYFAARGIAISLFIHSRKAPLADTGKIRSILIIRIDRIGDVIVSLPTVKAISTIFPDAKITMLVNKSIAPLLQGLPYIAEILPYEGFKQSMRQIQARKFDMAIDLLMDYSMHSALIVYASCAPVRVGFDIEGRGRFFNITVPPDHKEKHMSEHILDIARALGTIYNAEDRADWSAVPHLTISEDAAIRADELLKNAGIRKGDRVITVHPGGHFSSQCWMPEAFAELADRVAKKQDAKIVIIGSSAERGLVEGIVAMTKIKPVIIVGESVDAVAAVIARSDLLICNNSGPLHIASALGIPTVSTMGPTVPYLWWPLGSENTVLRHGLPCNPCSLGACQRHDCMKLITVEDMEEAVAYRLERLSAGNGPRANPILAKADLATILVINLGGIGDVILSTPALRSLASAYPRAKIYFLGVKRVTEFVKKLLYIDEVFDLCLDISPAAIVKNIQTLRRIRGLKIDLAINMRTLLSRTSALKINVLLRLTGAKITSGRDTEGLGGFFDIRIPESRRGDKSEMEYDLDMVKALGCDIITKRPDFVTDNISSEKVRSMLTSNGVAEGDILIGIHPGGKMSHRWKAENFAAVIDGINANVKARFIITGDGSDSQAARKVSECAKTAVIDATRILNLTELASLIKRCNLYICNDTAPMHIAAIFKVPLIAIFGPGYLKRFDPRVLSKDAVVITSEALCAPCDRVWCSRPECLNNIPVDEVLRAAMEILRSHGHTTI